MSLISRTVRVHGVDGRFYVGVLCDLCCFDVHRAPRVFCGCSVCVAVHRAAARAHQYAFRAIRAGGIAAVTSVAAESRPHRDGISWPRRAFCAVWAGGGAAAAASRTKTVRTRAPCEPKRQALELKRVRTLARRDGQHGAQLRGQRGHRRAGGDTAHCRKSVACNCGRVDWGSGRF